MNLLAKIARLSLIFFPTALSNTIRKIIPISLKSYLAKQIMKDFTAKNKDKDITVEDGRKFIMIKDGHFLRIIFEKNYEPHLSAITKKLIRKNDNAVDVGANFGWYTTLFCMISNGGEIFSYEPIPYSYNILDKNIQLNDMKSFIKVRKVGVGDNNGHFLMETGAGGSLAHVTNKSSNSSIKVPVVTLNDELSYLKNQISYIKIDIEGSEYSALKGAEEILKTNHQPIVQIELNEEALERSGSSRNEVVQFMRNIGYSFYEVSHNSPGYLQESNTEKCSDVFCFGRGKYSDRLKYLLLS